MPDDMTLDDMTMVGCDGIRRSFDEHFDTMMMVEQDPSGAHHAIHNQHARIEELEAKLANAVEEKLCAISTLDAWFDRRKLGHAAIDQAVIDAASGYLRVSRCGGMSQKKSDLILGVIHDMARLGLFADLFARTTLAELKGRDDE
jgi:hypothetical protein